MAQEISIWAKIFNWGKDIVLIGNRLEALSSKLDEVLKRSETPGQHLDDLKFYKITRDEQIKNLKEELNTLDQEKREETKKLIAKLEESNKKLNKAIGAGVEIAREYQSLQEEFENFKESQASVNDRIAEALTGKYRQTDAKSTANTLLRIMKLNREK